MTSKWCTCGWMESVKAGLEKEKAAVWRPSVVTVPGYSGPQTSEVLSTPGLELRRGWWLETDTWASPLRRAEQRCWNHKIVNVLEGPSRPLRADSQLSVSG